MLRTVKTISINGTSIINNMVAMAMYANIPETGPAIIGQTITDNQLYVANKSECDSDYDNFKTKVNKLLAKVQ